jgi:Putative Actinobacterial Holin-X, holin superfamily III
VWLVELGVPDPVAYLVAGVVGALVSALLGWTGMNRLKPSNLAPERTMKQFQRDAAVVREQMK